MRITYQVCPLDEETCQVEPFFHGSTDDMVETFRQHLEEWVAAAEAAVAEEDATPALDITLEIRKVSA
jgi:hypothetical protein